jgi:hypothetical protein
MKRFFRNPKLRFLFFLCLFLMAVSFTAGRAVGLLQAEQKRIMDLKSQIGSFILKEKLVRNERSLDGLYDDVLDLREVSGGILDKVKTIQDDKLPNYYWDEAEYINMLMRYCLYSDFDTKEDYQAFNIGVVPLHEFCWALEKNHSVNKSFLVLQDYLKTEEGKEAAEQLEQAYNTVWKRKKAIDLQN